LKTLRQTLAEVDAGTWVEPTAVTVAEYLQTWLRESVAGRVSAKTLDTYGRIIKRHLSPQIGTTLLTDLKPLHVQAFYGRLAETGNSRSGDQRQGLSPASIHQIHAVLHSALRQAVRWQILARNVADAADLPRIRRAPFRILAPAEERLLLASAEPVLRDLIQFAVESGARRGELLALRRSDMDIERRLMVISRSLTQVGSRFEIARPKTEASTRGVVMTLAHVQVYHRLVRRLAEERLRAGPAYEDGGLLFCSPTGRPLHPGIVSSRFGILARSLGLGGLRFHDLRHTHATRLLELGTHPKVVAERLGHTTIAMTMRYSHVTPGIQEEAIALLDAASGRQSGAKPGRRPPR